MVHRLAIPLVLMAATTALAAQQQPPTFTSTTRLVTVAVSVTDPKTGAPVAGLTKDDFRIESNGQPRPIVQFAGDPGPVTVAVLLDASGSMQVNGTFTPASHAAWGLLQSLEQGRDRAAVFSFDKDVALREGFGPVGPAHQLALEHLRAFGSTSLYDAVRTASEAAAQDAHPRRGVVVYTDGLDTSSLSSPAEVRRLAATLDVPLYLIAVMTPGTPAKAGYVDVAADHPMRTLADDTGGRLFAATPGVGIARAQEEILSSLRRHYLLAFEPDLRPGWHPLTVRTVQSHTVRARAGYVVSPRS